MTAPLIAPLIAIVGCDGSGKSTLARDLAAELGRRYPVEIAYLGLGSGEIGKSIARWPLIGPAFEAFLAKRARQTRTEGERIPGPVTALVHYTLSRRRLRRFQAAQARRARGVVVLTDRYPQVEVPGFYDGPGLSAARPGDRLVAMLVARERQMYEAMAADRPDLVIRLNVDLATAAARKPDHDVALLRKKVEATPRLRFKGARILDLDGRAPYAAVRERALTAILDILESQR